MADEMPTEQINDIQIELVVFERKNKRSHWRYLSSYKADTQAQLDASESTIRKLYPALHKNDGVEWAVLGIQTHLVWTLRLQRKAQAFRSLEQIPGVVCLQFPEAVELNDDVTPRCTCGHMVAVINERTVCTVCGAEGILSDALAIGKQQAEVAHA